MRKYICCTLLALAFTSAKAQIITVNEDPNISRMMDLYTLKNKEGGAFEGWRIQLAATTDRKKIDDVESTFKSKYPDTHIEWVHVKPYYKVRAGAFASRNGATQFLKSIKADFPDAYIVPDKIKATEVVGN